MAFLIITLPGTISVLIQYRLNPKYTFLYLSNIAFQFFREYFGLKKIKTFNEINPDLFEKNPDLLQKLIQAYDGRLDNIDVYIGMY